MYTYLRFDTPSISSEPMTGQVCRVLPREFVYLHQGSREGFIHLVRKGLLNRAYLPDNYAFIKAPTRCFPKEISDELEPYEIENFLCCMKDELAKL